MRPKSIQNILCGLREEDLSKDGGIRRILIERAKKIKAAFCNMMEVIMKAKESDERIRQAEEAPVPDVQPVDVTYPEERRKSKDTGCHLVREDVTWNAISRMAG